VAVAVATATFVIVSRSGIDASAAIVTASGFIGVVAALIAEAIVRLIGPKKAGRSESKTKEPRQK
jgi:hypothetical protein